MLDKNILILILLAEFVRGKESPGFFIKVSKNIPRLGRRADLFDHGTAVNDRGFLKEEDYVPTLHAQSKKSLDNTKQTNQLKFYNNVQPYDSIYSYILSLNTPTVKDDLKFVSWSDFDKTLDNDRIMYDKLISLHKQEPNKYPELINKLAFVNLMSTFNNKMIETNDI